MPRELASRPEDGLDRRRVTLKLTPRGPCALSKFRPATLEDLSRSLQAVSAEDREASLPAMGVLGDIFATWSKGLVLSEAVNPARVGVSSRPEGG